MKTKHTPTPWKVRHDSDESGDGYMIEDKNGYPIANTMYFASDKDTREMHKKWDKENAQFIVTACNAFEDMLEALKNLLWNFDGKETDLSLVQKRAIKYAKAAISKAEAKQHS